ncbi:MAG: 1-deoxy-D-xylulose-5-phosphate reductoisomerase [Deltaproteobacteria bacterium]|nr:1-deoxy-D-xylulose-5-phosphate reductoisomerase [Deltaproteobacteria bacterium]
MKSLCILGSTGSIGQNTLRIVEQFPELFRVKALVARSSITLLAEQIQRFQPEMAVVFDPNSAQKLSELLPAGLNIDILSGSDGLKAAATLDSVTLVVGAMVGAAGLIPVLDAISAGKEIALANKETLVMAGDLVMGLAAERKIRILPIDSEHSAIFQCLQGSDSKAVEKLILTCSGGPFRHKPMNEFSGITVSDALSHPNWEMGKKISIDSATLMNKGLEVIEAHHLFGLSRNRIDVVIHPQSVIHSMVAFQDGSVMAQMGIPDMKTAISYALSYPERLPLGQALPDFPRIGALTFETPDMDKFPCLKLACIACDVGETLPAVLNASNEIAVQAFLDGKIGFSDIPGIIRNTMDRHTVFTSPGLDEILGSDSWARAAATAAVEKLCK